MPIDPKKATAAEVAEGLALLEKKRVRSDRIAKGEIKGTTYTAMGDLSPGAQEKLRDRSRRARVKGQLLMEKAIKKGITVSESEIQNKIATMRK
jgi:hypothetical protein